MNLLLFLTPKFINKKTVAADPPPLSEDKGGGTAPTQEHNINESCSQSIFVYRYALTMLYLRRLGAFDRP